MARIAVGTVGAHLCAFLDMLAFSEIGAAMLADPRSDDGYRILVGSTPGNLILLTDYSHHPHIINESLNSSATGRYQMIFATWEGCRKRLKLPDIGPISQDRAAIELLHEGGALPHINAGDAARAVEIAAAISTEHGVWASLPGAGAKLPDGSPQHENDMDALVRYYGERLKVYWAAPDRFGVASVSGSIA